MVVGGSAYLGVASDASGVLDMALWEARGRRVGADAWGGGDSNCCANARMRGGHTGEEAFVAQLEEKFGFERPGKSAAA